MMCIAKVVNCILAVFLVLCVSCTTEPKADVTYQAFCTCSHGNERVWYGAVLSRKHQAEKERDQHNQTDGHCAVVETRKPSNP